MSDSISIILLGIGMLCIIGILAVQKNQISNISKQLEIAYKLMNESFTVLSESDKLLLLLLMKVRQ